MKVTALFAFLFLSVIAASAQKNSYPANHRKIDNIAFMTGACLTEGCYTWITLIMLNDGVLLEQFSVHRPAGAKSRFNRIGNWRISADTIHLDVIDTAKHNIHLNNSYKIVTMYERMVLFPVSGHQDFRSLEIEIRERFPRYFEDYFGFGLDDIRFKDQVVAKFEEFVRREYSAKHKVMIGELVKERVPE